MKIYLTGDTHGNDVSKLNSKFFPIGDTLNKNDYVIILGDFGCPWFDLIDNKIENISKPDSEILNFYNNKPWTTLFIPGNHENYNNLKLYPEVILDSICIENGPKVKKISESIYMLQNGFYQFNKKLVYCYGGATSIDKQYRIKDISWWEEEVPNVSDMNKCYLDFINFNKIPNYIFSHTTNSIIIETLIDQKILINFGDNKIKDPVTEYLDNILKYIKNNDKNDIYEMNFCGHFHVDKYLKDHKTLIFYQQILELNVDN